MPLNQANKKETKKEITCAFCKGKGTDPFEVMSALSKCYVCQGKGTIEVQAPYERCAHCRGTGAIKTFSCTVCGGKGVVPLPVGPTVVCQECKGTGDDISAPAMMCLKCHGRGWVPQE